LLSILILLCLPFAVSAQTRKRTVPKKTPPPVTTIRPVKEVVATHVKNLTRFVYLLGGVARSIEEVDAAARKGQVSQQVINETAKNKTKLVESIANWRIAMDELEINFKTKTPVQKYFPKISGVGQLTATAEDQAKAGQFSQAGQTLLQVISQLTDTLLEMQ
jgi:hypothetical protein